MKISRIAVPLFVILAGMAGVCWWYGSGTIVAGTAAVDGLTLTATAKVPGCVQDVPVHVGDRVQKNQVLFSLDAAEYDAAEAEARAMLAKIAATLPPQVLVRHPDNNPASDEAGLDQARDEENALRKAVEVAAAAQARTSVLLAVLLQKAPDKNADNAALVSARQTDDMARATLEKARDDFEKASYRRAVIEAAERDFTGSAGQVPVGLAAQIALYNAQQTRVRVAEENRAAAIVRAPLSGQVLEIAVRPGQVIEAGSAGAVLLPDSEDGVWVTAVFTPEQADRLRSGQACDVVLPARGNLTLKGRLASLQSAVEGRKNATARVVFVNRETLPQGLVPGESASVTVFTRDPERATKKSVGNANATR